MTGAPVAAARVVAALEHDRRTVRAPLPTGFDPLDHALEGGSIEEESSVGA